MGSFSKQQVAVNTEQRLKQWWPFVSVCERRVKEPQRWERPRQPAFSHCLEGTAFLRRLFIVRKTVRKKKEGEEEEEWLSKGSAALCVNTYKERCQGPLYWTVSKQRARQMRSVFKASLLNKNTAADHNIKIICVIFMLWRFFKNDNRPQYSSSLFDSSPSTTTAVCFSGIWNQILKTERKNENFRTKPKVLLRQRKGPAVIFWTESSVFQRTIPKVGKRYFSREKKWCKVRQVDDSRYLWAHH